MTGIILAGGPARRMKGRPKALLEVAGAPILAHVLAALEPLCQEILLVIKEPALYRGWGDRVRLISDREQQASPALGLYHGLQASRADYNLVVAADMPFLDPAMLGTLRQQAEGFDVAIPRWRDRLEPLHAIYHRRCLGALQARLAAGDHALHRLLPDLRVCYWDCGETARPRSFFNVNRLEDLRLANELAAGPTGCSGASPQ